MRPLSNACLSPYMFDWIQSTVKFGKHIYNVPSFLRQGPFNLDFSFLKSWRLRKTSRICSPCINTYPSPTPHTIHLKSKQIFHLLYLAIPQPIPRHLLLALRVDVHLGNIQCIVRQCCIAATMITHPNNLPPFILC